MRRLLFGIVWLAGHLVCTSSSPAEDLQDAYSIEVVIAAMDGSLFHGKQVCSSEAQCRISIGENFWANSLHIDGKISFDLFGPYIGVGNIECCGINGPSRTVQIRREVSMFSGNLYYIRRFKGDDLSFLVPAKFGKIYIAVSK